MSGFDQSSIAVSMPTVVGADAALGGPFVIKPSEAFSGALMTISGLTGETISVETSPDAPRFAPASPAFYRTDWQGTKLLYSTARTNSLTNSAFAGGGAVPTSWTQPTATGTSATAVSTSGGPGAAYVQTAVAERPYFNQAHTWLANTTYCFSVIVEEVTGLQAQDLLRHASSLPSGTVTYPICSANPNGTANGALVPGVLIVVFAIAGTGAAGNIRVGLGPNGAVTGSARFSHPQMEVSSNRTSWISTGSPTTVTDYTISGGLITLAETPAAGAVISYDDSVLPSPYFGFATGNGTQVTFPYDAVYGALSANSGKGNGIWQVDLRGAQAYRLVKSAGSETATVNMTLKRDALQYTNSAGTWSVT